MSQIMPSYSCYAHYYPIREYLYLRLLETRFSWLFHLLIAIIVAELLFACTPFRSNSSMLEVHTVLLGTDEGDHEQIRADSSQELKQANEQTDATARSTGSQSA